MRVAVFQRGNLGEHIIEGLKKYGRDIEILSFSVPENLPTIIENPEEYIKTDFDVDLIIDHLSHADLTEFLAKIARGKNTPIITPGRKVRGATFVATCCSLNMKGFKFGQPKLEVKVKDGKIADIKVVRGAPCGATWGAAEKVKGMKVEEAIPRIAIEVQYLCKAKAKHYFSKKPPLHVAGDLHIKALEKAVKPSR